ncbi:MAG: MerR family transcriptional regulator [Clostridiaceae bacterium]|nr:MerR family transcriptional regulator [Eubacteriales bacterium]
MGNLTKVREVSLKYDISTRALKYYEDMGLMKSARSENYAYRVYDEASIKRLEQILILRKLNISIKDIARIFSASGSEVVLEVLSNKVSNIDEEVALLHELKGVVLDFIKQIQQSDFHSDSDVKLLYEKAKVLERQLTGVAYDGNPSPVNQLLNVAAKLEKMPDIRVVYIPPLKMARSGNGDLDEFDRWWSGVDTGSSIFPRDFLWYNEKLNCFEWLFAIPDGLSDTNGYEVFNFPGGLYAVATAVDGDEINKVNRLIHKWAEENEFFEPANSRNDANERYDMGHIVTPPIFQEKTGYHLMDVFVPIVERKCAD